MNQFESCGDHLRNLLSPYKLLINLVNKFLSGDIDKSSFEDFIKKQNFQKNLNKLIEFSEDSKLEKINWRSLNKEDWKGCQGTCDFEPIPLPPEMI